MLSGKKKLQLAGGFAALLSYAAALGCGGFFVDPTLTSLAISPATFTLQTVGQTQQLTATGTYNDGSTKNLTGTSTWSSSDTAVATVSGTGLVTAKTSTSGLSATITVTNTSKSGAVSGTATATIGAASGTVTVTCTSCTGNTISISGNGGAGTQVSFTADENGTDVTSQAAWTSSNTQIISNPSGGNATLGGTTGTVTITATVSGASGNVQVTVNP
jgi:hypothetical protein